MIKYVFWAMLFISLAPTASVAGYYNFTRLQRMPSSVKVGSSVMGLYLIKNTSGSARNVYIRALPSFVVVQSGMGVCINGGPLASNETCRLKLNFNANKIGEEFNDQSFLVCPSPQYNTGCLYLTDGYITTAVD